MRSRNCSYAYMDQGMVKNQVNATPAPECEGVALCLRGVVSPDSLDSGFAYMEEFRGSVFPLYGLMSGILKPADQRAASTPRSTGNSGPSGAEVMVMLKGRPPPVACPRAWSWAGVGLWPREPPLRVVGG